MQTTTKKGKEGRKGQKQIVAENQETLTHYKNMVFGATGIYLIGMVVFSKFTKVEIFWMLFAVVLYTACYQFMVYISKAKYSDSGHLIDSGVDLNMQGGMAEHLKDVIILTSTCQVLSLFSNYFWLGWLPVPLRVLWLVWEYLLQPYFFQPGPANTEEEKNKNKNKRRKKKSKWFKLV